MSRQPEYLHQVYPDTKAETDGDTPSTPHELDIVFVHGLNPVSSPNFAVSTWTHANGNFWPVTQLPKLIPSARILVFSYNSQVAWDVSSNGIAAHAESLLDRLSGARQGLRKQACYIPIIFVAHSLGGLVVKQALVSAKNNDAYSSIRQATYGLVFFAVPHQGGHRAGMGAIAKNIVASMTGNSYNDLVESLKQNSLFQENQAQLFRHQLEDYWIISFCEGRPTMYKGFKGLFRPITSFTVVDNKSATLGLGGKRERLLTIDEDHSHLCKFASDDDVFEPVGRGIKDLADGAIKQANASEESDQEQSQSAERDKIIEHLNKVDFSHAVNMELIHHSLIRKLCEGTTKWFVARAEFQDWATGVVNSLWVKGKAGSGKTYLAASVVQYLQSTAQPQTHPIRPVIGIFCTISDPGTLIVANLMQTLVRQLSESLKPDSLALRSMYQMSLRNKDWYKDKFYLDEILAQIFREIGGAILIFDGLDECKEPGELGEFLISLTSPGTSGVQVIVFARVGSEIEDGFIDCFASVYMIVDEDVSQDISTFVRSEIGKRRAPGVLRRLKIRDPKLNDTIVETLPRYANGVFLWASCQLDEICMQRTDEDILKTLDSLPPGMEKTYERMLSKVVAQRPDDLRLAKAILCWVLSANRRLRLDEIAIAIAVRKENPSWDPSLALTDSTDVVALCGGFIVQDSGFAQLVHASGKTFLEGLPAGKNLDLHLSNYTVLCACITLIFAVFDVPMKIENPFQYGTASCLTPLRSSERDEKMTAQEGLQKYAYREWPSHAMSCQNGGIPYTSVILDLFNSGLVFQRWLCEWMTHNLGSLNTMRRDILLSRYEWSDKLVVRSPGFLNNMGQNTSLGECEWIDSHVAIVPRQDVWEPSSCLQPQLSNFTTSDQITLLAFLGLGEAVKSMVENLETDLAAKTLLHLPENGSFLSGNSALHSAAAGAHIELCRNLLLQDHLNINITNDFGQTPIHFAAAIGAKDIIRLFVDHGARVGAEDLMGHSSFHYLATGDSTYYTEDDRLRCLDLMHPSPQRLDALAPKLPTLGQHPRLQQPEVDALGRQSTSVELLVTLPTVMGVAGSMLEHAWKEIRSPEGNKKLGISASALHMFRYDLPRQDELLLEGAGTPGHTSYYTLVDSPTPPTLNPLTPFLGAVMSDRLDLAVYLAAKGSIATRKDAQGHSAAHIISRTFGLSKFDAQIAMLRSLCELGLDMQDKDVQLRTPLFHAISAGNIPIIEYLMEHGADLETQDAFGRTVFHHLANAGALLWNQTSLVQRTLDTLLSKPQPNLTIKDANGLTAVSLALENEWTWGAERLLQAGALCPSPEEALRILHKVLVRVINQSRSTFDPGKGDAPKNYFPEKLFDLLTSFGAGFENCWPVDQSGIPRSLLCTAVFASDVCMVQYLCKRPVNVHTLGHSGLPPIFIALASPHIKKHKLRVAILHALLNAGANADEYRQDVTPLSYIVMMMDENKAELASIFIQHGANVNLRMSTGQSYTQLAVMFGREQLPLIKTLLLAPRRSRLRSQDTLALTFDEPGIEHYQMQRKGSIPDEIPSFLYKGYFKRGPRRKHSVEDLGLKSVWPA